MSTGPARKGVGAVKTVIRQPLFVSDKRIDPPSAPAGVHHVSRSSQANSTPTDTGRIPILPRATYHASAWVGEQSRPRPRRERGSATPRAPAPSGLLMHAEIDSVRSENRNTARVASPDRETGFPAEGANPRRAGSKRVPKPACQGRPSQDHRQAAGARELPHQSSPGSENCSEPATC